MCVCIYMCISPMHAHLCRGFPMWLRGKNSPARAGDTCLIPELGRFFGGEKANPLQYSCLGNIMDRGSWWSIVHWGHKE